MSRQFKTGQARNVDVGIGLLHSTEAGEILFMKLKEERLKRAEDNNVSFLKPKEKLDY